MTHEELKDALISQRPVVHQTHGLDPVTKYKCVSAIIYRMKNGKIDISAELADYTGRSTSIVDPKMVKYE